MGAIILLALSVSLDSLSTGMAYAISGIRIPWTTKLMMAVLNGCLTFAAVLVGSYLGQIVPERYFQIFGGGVLLALGGRTLWCVWKKQAAKDYDQDGSKVLEPWEGLLIGLTMAFDSMSAGLGLPDFGSARYAFPLFTAFAGVAFLTIGNYIRINIRCINALGGFLLIGLGLFRCLFAWY